jgi:hypothetical protein
MNKKEFISVLDEKLREIGFTRKRNTWTLKGNEISKKVFLQKSKYGNLYYLNFGFIIEGLQLDPFELHVHNVFSSIDDNENEFIKNILDFDNETKLYNIENELINTVEKNLLEHLSSVNTIDELKHYLKERENLNDIPLIVKNKLSLK